MEFKQLIMERYATKKFDGRKIDEGKLNEILEMIRFSPSALNLQPWKIKVIHNQELKDKLYTASGDQAQITTCSHLLVFCANTDLKSNAEKVFKGMELAGVPEEKIELYKNYLKTSQGLLNKETGLCEAQKNVFIAATHALYAAKSLGIDSCPMQGFDQAAYSKILGLPSTLVPTLLVPLGYAADEPMPKNRFPKEDIFF